MSRVYKRKAAVAVLVVGEGFAEEVFIKHLKQLYLERGCGTTAMVRNANGNGGAGVLRYAIAQRNGNKGFARTVALLDTDADWDDHQRAIARKNGILVVECSPCIEAVLLAAAGRLGERSSAEHKALFLQIFGAPAHQADIYPQHFGKRILDAARAHVGALDRLISALVG